MLWTRVSRAPIALALAALCSALGSFGCEHLLGVDFSDLPLKIQADGAAASGDALHDSATNDGGDERGNGVSDSGAPDSVPAPAIWTFRGGPKHQGRSRFRMKRPTRIAWRYPAAMRCRGEPLIDAEGRATIMTEGADYPTPIALLSVLDGVARPTWKADAVQLEVSGPPLAGPSLIELGQGGDIFVAQPTLQRVWPASGQLWSAPTVGGQPIIDLAHGAAIVQSADSVSAFDLNGKNRWTASAPFPTSERMPALRDDGSIVYAGHLVNAIASDGAPLWSTDVSLPPGIFLSSPVVGDDGRTIILTLRKMGNDLDYKSGATGAAVVAATGKVITGAKKIFAAHCAHFPALSLDGSLIVNCLGRVQAHDPDTLALRWTFMESFGDYYELPANPSVDAAGLILVPQSSGTGDSGSLDALRPDGTLEWTFALPSGAVSASIGPDGAIVACLADGSLLMVAE